MEVERMSQVTQWENAFTRCQSQSKSCAHFDARRLIRVHLVCFLHASRLTECRHKLFKAYEMRKLTVRKKLLEMEPWKKNTRILSMTDYEERCNY